jgi:hypothetical protein
MYIPYIDFEMAEAITLPILKGYVMKTPNCNTQIATSQISQRKV